MPRLEWIGKEKVINHHLEVPFRVLNRKYSFDQAGQQDEDNGSANKIIHGDNLLALKSLLPEYEGKIKCIYIDPPYNTGNEGWVYNDNVNDPKMRKWLGEVVGKEGEDLSRHDKWLCMMYPRLKLLQKLLADDGAIFISIDDNEQAHLRLLCDEIFGKSNFINNIIWEKKFSRSNDAKYFSEQHDFILTYAKHKEMWNRNFLPKSIEQNSRYKNPDGDSRGVWQSVAYNCNKNKDERPNLYYPIENPNTGEIIMPSSTCVWRYTKERHEENIKKGLIYWGANGKGRPRFKKFLDEDAGLVPMTIWKTDFAGDNQFSRKEYRKILGENAFDFQTPKPSKLIERVLQIATNKDSIVLDSFAGSGTTAQAVLNLNKQDGGHRKFILVEMDAYADTITAERVKRVIKGYGDSEGIPGDFSYYEIGEPLLEGDVLNPHVAVEKIRSYIWYMETRQPYQKPATDNEAFLGQENGTAYYFHYDPAQRRLLDEEFLRSITTRAEHYVIYADECLLSEAFLQKHAITFKKIPRDIARL